MSMPVVEAVLVTDARIWSYLCDDEVCCPPQGRERSLSTKGSLALSAAHALNGRAVLPNRDAVVASVQAVTGIRRAEMERAIDDATAAHAAIEPRRARTRARRLANKLRARYQERPGTLTDTEAAALIVALHDHQLRDVMIGWADGDPDAIALPRPGAARSASARCTRVHVVGVVFLPGRRRACRHRCPGTCTCQRPCLFSCAAPQRGDRAADAAVFAAMGVNRLRRT
jgi:hypothetical protein